MAHTHTRTIHDVVVVVYVVCDGQNNVMLPLNQWTQCTRFMMIIIKNTY